MQTEIVNIIKKTLLKIENRFIVGAVKNLLLNYDSSYLNKNLAFPEYYKYNKYAFIECAKK